MFRNFAIPRWINYEQDDVPQSGKIIRQLIQFKTPFRIPDVGTYSDGDLFDNRLLLKSE